MTSGLDPRIAAERLQNNGPNVLVPRRRGEMLKEVLRTLADPMAIMLALTGAVYFALGEQRDGAIMFGALVPVLGVDVALEARSRRALKALANAVAPHAHVVRGGATTEIPAAEVVVGDIVLLEAGDVVPADACAVRAANLSLDESHLTGESEPVSKQASDDPGPDAVHPSALPEARLFAGAIVLAGTGAARVLATGTDTRFAEVARLVSESQSSLTPLQRKVVRAFRGLAVVALVVAAGVFGLALARGQGVRLAFLSAVSLTMAAMPEEFPLVFTLFLSFGAFRLGKKGVLVRRLAAVETLGSTTVLCVDKTGTLTVGRFGLSGHFPWDGVGDEDLLTAAALACESPPADPLEMAIEEHGREHGIDGDPLRARFPMVHDYDFDPVGKHMAHVRSSDSGSRVDMKGALTGVLDHCELAPGEREKALDRETELARQGLRVIAVASRPGEDFTGDRERDEVGLRLLGLLTFGDPLRPEVPPAIESCKEAGIDVKILTGDHGLTAAAIAEAAGIPVGEGSMVTGPELAELSSEELARRVDAATILARLQPEQKYDIVKGLKTAGEVVAMTGDGINDAPALEQADIGVSMGPGATEVARSAADLVLLEDRFDALVDTVREGRAIYANLKRAFLYLIAFHIPIIVLAVSVPLLDLPLLLLPVHLVWLELIVHPVSAIVFDAEKAGGDIMKHPPRAPSAPLVGGGSLLRSVLAGVLLSAATLLAWTMELSTGPATARAIALATLILGSVLLVLGEQRRGEGAKHRSLVPKTLRSRIVVGAVLASLPLAIYVPALARALTLAAPSAAQWGLAALLAVGSTGWHVVVGGGGDSMGMSRS